MLSMGLDLNSYRTVSRLIDELGTFSLNPSNTDV